MLILIPFCLLVLTVPFANTSSNPRLHEIEKLLQRFDSYLDVNYLFYDIYRSQKHNPLLCKAEHGPYCSMINHKSITTGVLDTHENPEIEIRKEAILAEYDILRTKKIFGLSNTERDKLLQPLTSSTEQPKEIETLLTFEEAVLNTEDSEITNPLVWNKERGFQADTSKPVGQTSKNDVRVTFQGIYVPAVAKVTDKKTMSEKAKMDKENEGKDLKEHRPVSVYAYSKTTEGGEMRFSRAIKVKQIWARKHNMDVHEEEMKAQGQHKYVFEYDIKGQRDGKNVVGFKKDWTDMSTTWTLMKPVTEGIAVDRLLIPKNTDLDNLLLEIDLEEEMKLMTVGEYQDMMNHINGKLRNFANLEDEGLRNQILGDEVKMFLLKRNFDEMFIKRLLHHLIIKKIDKNTFDVKLEAIESFVEKFVAYKNFVLVVNPGEAKKIKDTLKAALKDSTKKSAEFQDLTEGQLKEMLEKMDQVNFDEYDQQVILKFLFEEKQAGEGVSASGESGKKGKAQDDL